MFSGNFVDRHIGLSPADEREMLQTVGVESVAELLEKVMPEEARQSAGAMDLPAAQSEEALLEELEKVGSKNSVRRSHLGVGYFDSHCPAAIQRNILENPSWYTQYTPYQAEISQGRLEALYNFQTMTVELTGLPVANASLLDEGTAAAEAALMLHSVENKDNSKSLFVADTVNPQTLEVLKTRLFARNINVVVGNPKCFAFDSAIYGAVLQVPDAQGVVDDHRDFIAEVKKRGGGVVLAVDPLASVVLPSAGAMGADVAVGNSGRFGVGMGYGGPHAAFFATKEKYRRMVPGRIVGLSVDRSGAKAFRLCLQTREQHIRRERATSNICTAQALLGIVASTYAVYHGPQGLKRIAEQVHTYTKRLAQNLRGLGYGLKSEVFFDTVTLEVGHKQAREAVDAAAQVGRDIRRVDDHHVAISFDETSGEKDVRDLTEVFKSLRGFGHKRSATKTLSGLPAHLRRTEPFLEQNVFNSFHTETELVRYIKRLERKDISLADSMIPLGSCTMKLNATAELACLSKPNFTKLHPFVAEEHAQGYQQIFKELSAYLCEVTGLEACSLQPNSGSQGEFAGLLVIKAYLESCKQGHRRICLIPESAHGTNPASAALSGMKVMRVACNDSGNMDVADLDAKLAEVGPDVAALMITYPSTFGVFEKDFATIIEKVHQSGGLVYMDGANFNAMAGYCQPGKLGVDVCHLNLHKTFCIPHGGGGPGMGPIVTRKDLAPYLPGNTFAGQGGNASVGAVSSAPWGSASILPISWSYFRLMGLSGLRRATETAILSANYVAKRLSSAMPVLFFEKNGCVAHECIVDFRSIKARTGVSAMDVAKRLVDYGFHAPTVSFPIVDTLMIEPTESESKAELDRFCEAMLDIKADIDAMTTKGEDSVFQGAPHTAEMLVAGEWQRPYSREKAFFPLGWVKERKFWPPVSRVEEAFGDRNFCCAWKD